MTGPCLPQLKAQRILHCLESCGYPVSTWNISPSWWSKMYTDFGQNIVSFISIRVRWISKADAPQRALNSGKTKMWTKKNWLVWLATFDGAIHEKHWCLCTLLPQECYTRFLKSFHLKLYHKHVNEIKILENQQDYIRPFRGFGTHMTIAEFPTLVNSIHFFRLKSAHGPHMDRNFAGFPVVAI